MWTLLSVAGFFGLLFVFFLILMVVLNQGAKRESLHWSLQKIKGTKQELYKLHNKDPDAKAIILAICNFHLNVDQDWDAALKFSKLACERWPREPAPYLTQSTVLRQQGNLIAAEQVLATGIGRVSANPWLRTEYARLAEKHMPQEALKRWQSVQQLFPRHCPAFVGETRILLAIGRLAEAQLSLDRALALEPKNENALLLDAEIAEASDDWSAAAIKWENFRNQFDTKPQGYMRGAAACRQSGDLVETERLLKAASVIFALNKDVSARALAQLGTLHK